MSQKPDGTPCEGDVKIDGTSVGVTPWKGQLIAKDHAVNVNCDGAMASESVEVQHNSQSVLRIMVEPFDYEGLVCFFREDYAYSDESSRGVGVFWPLTREELGGDGVNPWEQIDRLNIEYSKPENHRFKNGKKFSIITTSGVVETEILSQGIWPGAGDIFHKAVVDWPKESRGAFGLAVYDHKLPRDLSLRAPTESVDSDAAKVAFTKTKNYMMTHTSKEFPDESRLINKMRLKPEHFSYVEARFPGQFEAIAIVHVPNDEASEYSYLAKYLFIDSDGNVIAGHEQSGWVHTILLVDLNQDGLDEVLLLKSGYESEHAELLVWDGAIPKTIPLWSDGG